jgi:hypothetical protein
MNSVCDTKSALGTAEPFVCYAKYCFCATESGGADGADDVQPQKAAPVTYADRRTPREYAGLARNDGGLKRG